MSTYAGTLPSALLTDFDEVSFTPSMPGPNVWPLASNACLVLDGALSGTPTNNAPIEMHPVNHAGVLLPGFAFGHVYALPSADIDLGTVIDGGTAEIEIWNAALESATCASATESEMDGIANDAPVAPFTLLPLGSLTVTYTVASNGPVDIAATHTLVFGTDTLAIALSGSRAVVLSLWPDNGIVETLSWLSDVITFRAGGEQRIAKRLQPRRSVKIPVRPPDRAFAQRLDNMAQAWRANAWLVPLFQEAQRITASVAAGATVLAVKTGNMTLVAGDRVMVWWSAASWAVVEVASLTDAAIVCAKPLSPPTGHVGAVYAVPVHPAVLVASPIRERTPGYPDKYTLEFRFTEDRDPDDTATLPQYLDMDVLADVAAYLQADKQDTQITRVISTVDCDTGQVFYSSPTDFSAQQTPLELSALTRAAAWDLRRFCCRRLGRVVPFWRPVYDQSMELAATINATDQMLRVEDRGFTLLSGQATRQHLVIELTDGTRFFREVTEITPGSSGQEVLTINDALGVSVTPAQIRTLCFLALCRLDADDVELTWGRPACKATLVSVEVAA
ncbi:MAG: hypothetical protein AB7U59_13685 [Desulfovibrionaceae bacterium]